VRNVGLDVARYPQSDPLFRVASLLSESGVTRVIDVGANSGQYASEIRRLGFQGAIVSLEPLLDPFSELAAKAAKDPNWQVLRFAAGSERGSALINVAANHGASSSLLPMLDAHALAAPDAMFIGTERIEVRTLDELWDEITSPTDIVFLKIDVQGFEKQVLDGSSDHLRDVFGIQMELSFVPLYDGGWDYLSALTWARDSGFELVALIPGFTSPSSSRMLQADGVFMRAN
jgi:FkbM family methyltransferase